MGGAVAMTRLDLTAGEVRRAARKERNSTVARRILVLALVLELEGSDRKKAAERVAGWIARPCGTWVHRYNAEGLAGLRSRQPMGPRSRLTTEHQAELAALVEAGVIRAWPRGPYDQPTRWLPLMPLRDGKIRP
jgi:hypothetical protein